MTTRVAKPQEGVIEISRPRGRAALELGVYVLFFAVWYSLLLGAEPLKASPWVRTLLRICFYGIPLLALPKGLTLFRFAVDGETWRFDRAAGSIERNGVPVGRFADVEQLRIRVIHGTDEPDEHRLSVLLTSGERLRIDESQDTGKITALAEDLSDLLDREVVRGRDA